MTDAPSTDDGIGHTIYSSAPSLVMEQLIACQISVWYPIFSNLTTTNEQQKRKNVTIRSIIIPIPNEFIQYLQRDGLFLPDGVQSSSILLQQSSNPNNGNKDDDWSSSSSSTDTDENNDDNGYDSKQQPQNNATMQNDALERFNNEIEKAMDQLYNRYELDDRSTDRAVLPKFNWSAPKDSIWINSGTMKCCSVGDIYMLSKASDFCSHDITITFPELQQYLQEKKSANDNNDLTNTKVSSSYESSTKIQFELCLRKWCYLYPSQEFRCFVKDAILIGISQRHISQHYEFLNDPILQDDYCTIIEMFYTTIIQPTIEQSTQLQILQSQYTFDIYIDKKNKIWLIDFNVWDTRTDALLFTWDELDAISTLDNQIHGEARTDDNDGDNARKYRTRSEESKANTDDDNENSIENKNGDEHNDDEMLLPIFRVVEVAKEIRPDPLSSYKAPIDALHMTSSISGSIGPERPPESTDSTTPSQFASNPTAFEHFMAMCQKPSATADDDDSDDSSTSSSSSTDK